MVVDLFMQFLRWTEANLSLITLAISSVLAITSLASTAVSQKMLKISSQPTLKIVVDEISLYPDIVLEKEPFDIETIINDNVRYIINIGIELINIGNYPAQEIYVDADVEFIKRKPFGYKYLPVHRYTFVDFLSPFVENGNFSKKKSYVSFDNFVAREMIKDFYEGKNNHHGTPFLPSPKEMRDPYFWSSPKINIKCLYSDIQKNYYCSELQMFFHIWKDPNDSNKLKIYKLNDNEFNYLGVKRISFKQLQKHFKKNRHLRYTAFDGKSYKKDDLVVLFRAKKLKK
jgi:hypothetical protein